MTKNLANVLIAAAFITTCAAQTVVPPAPDCLATSSKKLASRRAIPGDCPQLPVNILGAGTAGTIPVFKSSNTLGDSIITQGPAGIGIGGANSGSAKLAVTGN